LKNIGWTSALISRIMPRPDLMPLTGGYRRTPVMQIGTDIRCGTQCIIRERRFPEPALFPAGVRRARIGHRDMDRPVVLSEHRQSRVRLARRSRKTPRRQVRCPGHVVPGDYGKVKVSGEIVALSSQHIAIRRRGPRAGEMVVHPLFRIML
jgi:hypothetical protein